jgi:hypothetical protein
VDDVDDDDELSVLAIAVDDEDEDEDELDVVWPTVDDVDDELDDELDVDVVCAMVDELDDELDVELDDDDSVDGDDGVLHDEHDSDVVVISASKPNTCGCWMMITRRASSAPIHQLTTNVCSCVRVAPPIVAVNTTRYTVPAVVSSAPVAS